MIYDRKGISRPVKLLAVVSLLLVVVVLLVSIIFYSGSMTSIGSTSDSVATELLAKNAGSYADRIIDQPNLVPPNEEPYDATFFENYGVNPFVSTEDEVFSTFGMDVDTASYTVARHFINGGNMPDKDSVRTEEFINYFDQDYLYTDDVFTINLEGAESEFGKPNYHLLRVGISAKDVSFDERKPANMVFLVDVSGSMNRDDRLELVKKSLDKLVASLKSGDKVGLAVYAGGGGKILDLTHDKNAIVNALSELKAGGSTNLEQGLEIAYQMSRDAFEPDKINRIILCSDGVANQGITGADELLLKIKGDADDGITLTTLGFGMGNYNDVLMEKLANHGDGNYYYVDSLTEADRLFKDGATSLLQVVASDAKIQVEFNPMTVDRFRLMGYENRRLDAEDFRDDAVDAGEVGAGQTVTALYELRIKDVATLDEKVADIRVRYLDMDTKDVNEIHKDVGVSDIKNDFNAASPRFRFTAAVAEFAEVLKESYWAKDGSLDDVLVVAENAVSYMDADEKDLEFVELVKKAKSIE